MTLADRSRLPVGPKRYAADPDSRRAGIVRGAILVSTCVFCLLYGFFFSFFTPFLIMPFVVPVVALAGTTIWALPDLRRAPTGTMMVLFWAYLVMLLIWPNYIAIAPPGLPWITMIRLTGIPLTLVLLICVSISPTFRAELARVFSGVPVLWRLVLAFVVLQALSVGFSSNPFVSLDKFIVAQVGWTGVFVAAAYLFYGKQGRIERWAAALWALAIFVGLIGTAEHHYSRVLWAGHLPKFLQIDDPNVLKALAGHARSFDGIYRIEGTFSSSIAMSEFLALALPFIVQFAFGRYNWLVKGLAFLSIPYIVLLVHWTGSRSGVVGCLITLLMYILAWSVLTWRKSKGSIFGPAVALSYPLIFIVAIISTFVIGRLKTAVWGTAAQHASTVSRITQYKMGIPKIFARPWGYGIGQGGIALHYVTPQGRQTIDTYYLSVALEEGILGFILYYGMIGFAFYLCGLYAYRSVKNENRDYGFLVPIGISLISFFIICSVFSELDCHPLMWMMLGGAAALVSRFRQETEVKAPVVEAEPTDDRPVVRRVRRPAPAL
jgi:hypothetical protein